MSSITEITAERTIEGLVNQIREKTLECQTQGHKDPVWFDEYTGFCNYCGTCLRNSENHKDDYC